jgi:hypothetical protein
LSDDILAAGREAALGHAVSAKPAARKRAAGKSAAAGRH